MNKLLKALTCGIAMVVTTIAVGWPSPALAAYPNDPGYARQWGHRRIGLTKAWAQGAMGAGITVAVIDTGVNYTHPDLKANVLKKQYDAINDDGDAYDLQGHGTAVAGVVAAVTNNKVGVAGTAPKAKIMAVRAFGAQAGADPADVTDAIMWAADNGADVINLSLGADIPVNPYILQDVAVAYAVANGVLVVAAAGNAGSPYCGTPAFNPAAICVGATDSLDRLASFSNYFLRLDVVAPGKGIYTTGATAGQGYGSINGTSFASPYVAGVGALLMGMGADNITAGMILRASAKDLGLPGYDNTYGFGRLDAAAAVEMCREIC